MPEERFLTIQLHELLMYLGQQSVATILIGAHQGLIGSQMNTPVDASYLADAVILLRYFEAKGEVRQAISVMKKRGSKHERTIREFRLDGGRISVGEALRDFRGILTGVPVYEGPASRRRTRSRRERATTRRRATAACSSWRRPAKTPRSRSSLLSSAGIPLEICPTFDALRSRAEGGRRPRSWCPKKRCRLRHTATLRAGPRATAALVRSSRPRPDSPRRRFRGARAKPSGRSAT